jgi:PEP-CTERM motif-containing protein
MVGQAAASPVTDPNDPRSWQGATVGTFAQLFYGSNTLATRTQVVNAGLLDDGTFSAAGYLAGTLLQGTFAGCGTSYGVGTGNYSYFGTACTGTPAGADQANLIDPNWVQTGNVIGQTVWDLGFAAVSAAIFNTIDHGPLPEEAIEATVYVSSGGSGNPLTWTWTAAVTQKVWLEGFLSDPNPSLNIEWDGFVYAVGTPSNTPFRYASIIWGGPGAFQADGDNEINGIMGLAPNFQPVGAPEPASLLLLGSGLAALAARARRRSAKK